MFPLQPTTHRDLAFATPTTSPQGYQIHEDLITNYDFMENNLINFSIGSNDKELSKGTDFGLRRRRKKESRDECSSKKVMHREVERKRRQEMSNLYSSLRSLLPDDQIKGKRSVCDQMEEAAIHIKRMEKNIEELKIRRDELKSLFNSETLNDTNNVMVNMVTNGMEILISHSIKSSGLGLSQILAELQRCDLDVISCVSTRMEERFVHKIQVEVRGMTNLDVFVLKDRLSKAIK